MKFLVLFLALAKCVAGDRGDDFSNNLFSDLAPILTLFGERVTLQFLRESMGWIDHVIFAMAPLGIITAIVAAIRVGGPPWLQAIIGRARESRAGVEAELMSSTSKEVCELWNGHDVVRVMGEPPIREFICLIPRWTWNVEHYYDSESWNDNNDAWSFTDREHPRCIVIRNMHTNAPNISLNIHKTVSKKEAILVAILATIVQSGVIVYAGFTSYFSTMRFPKDGLQVAGYAFPCMAIGTVVLVTGMFICAHVVDARTAEKRYRPKGNYELRVVWLQREGRVNDQSFSSCAIFPSHERDFIITSERSSPRTDIAVVGALVSLCGFIAQFIGLRGLHWSVSVAQLGATIVMMALRAWICRTSSGFEKPNSIPLTRGSEMDWFASTLDQIDQAPWRFPEPQQTGDSITIQDSEDIFDVDEGFTVNEYNPEPGTVLLHIRHDMGWLAGWEGPFWKEAGSLARSMELALNSLDPSGHRCPTSGLKPETELFWKFRTRDGRIFRFKVQLLGPGNWHVWTSMVDAALSLLMSAVHHSNAPWEMASGDEPSTDGLWIIGQHSTSLNKDLQCWMPSGVSHLFLLYQTTGIRRYYDWGDDDENIYWVQCYQIIGSEVNPYLPRQFDDEVQYRTTPETTDMGPGSGSASADTKPSEYLANRSDKSLESLYNLEMFARFFMHAVNYLLYSPDSLFDIDAGKTNLVPGKHDNGPVHGWKEFNLQNTSISGVADAIFQSISFQWSMEDMYLCIIPPFSMRRKLPTPDGDLMTLSWKQAAKFVRSRSFRNATEAILWFLQQAESLPKSSPIYLKSVGMLVEFQLLVTHISAQQERLQYVSNDDRIPTAHETKKRIDITLARVSR
ncbi:hypothetical protein B0T19DRAFT_361642 [Cercophora scortea]|uniref:Uncharacterized protein n=1 Tax=Cercophora scortea TaxID=314031 RepID=A0AAE0M5K3_9PEZI|nr:hypothetical protein B0T19DRAFT_361642 [Cercophora scortea]